LDVFQVSDAAWSPTHPAVFAACNSAGQVSLFDLVHSSDKPRLVHDVRADAVPKDSAALAAAAAFASHSSAKATLSAAAALVKGKGAPLSKLSWAADGRRLAVNFFF